LDTIFGGAQTVAARVTAMTNGKFNITARAAGELAPGLEVLNVVEQGAVPIGHTASYYYVGKSPATAFGTALPFGFTDRQQNAWLYEGGGLELMQQFYADKFGVIQFPAGNTGVQMGGWFNREIKTIEDFKGLKMRIPGLGGKVLAKAGGTAVLSAGGEIYTNLERGVIDATEWVGPYNDYKMGFYKVAKYYYYPGWHEPGTVLETFVNKKAFEALPKDLQEIVTTAAMASNLWMLCESETKNNFYLEKMVKEEGVQLKMFPPDVIRKLRAYSTEVLDEIAAKDPLSKKVYESFRKFQKQHQAWGEISESAYAGLNKV